MSRFAVVLSTIVVVGLAICSAGLRGGAQKPASSLSSEAAVTDYCAAWNTEIQRNESTCFRACGRPMASTATLTRRTWSARQR